MQFVLESNCSNFTFTEILVWWKVRLAHHKFSNNSTKEWKEIQKRGYLRCGNNHYNLARIPLCRIDFHNEQKKHFILAFQNSKGYLAKTIQNPYTQNIIILNTKPKYRLCCFTNN